MTAIYATVGNYAHVKDQVLATRGGGKTIKHLNTMSIRPLMVAGITMSAGLRRPPNCFNLLRQQEVLQRAQVATEVATATWLEHVSENIFCDIDIYIYIDIT